MGLESCTSRGLKSGLQSCIDIDMIINTHIHCTRSPTDVHLHVFSFIIYLLILFNVYKTFHVSGNRSLYIPLMANSQTIGCYYNRLINNKFLFFLLLYLDVLSSQSALFFVGMYFVLKYNL